MAGEVKEEKGGRWAWVSQKAEWGGWLLGRLGWKLKKSFQNKIRFLNLPRLWKFAQGDLRGILTQEFLPNASRLLKDFKKIQYAMPRIQP
jgi:hypothetical protein